MISADKVRQAQKTKFQAWLLEQEESITAYMLSQAKAGNKEAVFRVTTEADLEEMRTYFAELGYNVAIDFKQESEEEFEKRKELEKSYLSFTPVKRWEHWQVTISW